MVSMQMQFCCFRFYKILISYSFIFCIDLLPCISPGLLGVANGTPHLTSSCVCQIVIIKHMTLKVFKFRQPTTVQCSYQTSWKLVNLFKSWKGRWTCMCTYTESIMNITLLLFFLKVQKAYYRCLYSVYFFVFYQRNDRNHNPVTS